MQIYIENIHNVSNCHDREKHCKFDARGTVVPNTATASAPAVEIEMATFTGAERARCVLVRRKEARYTRSKEISHSVSQGTSKYAYNLLVAQEFC
jgi:hypothetical protein